MIFTLQQLTTKKQPANGGHSGATKEQFVPGVLTRSHCARQLLSAKSAATGD
jgi:hypothetical protein